ncbi:hypothetical protein BH11VER1_BH11VER1_18030 [soil metagenome]
MYLFDKAALNHLRRGLTLVELLAVMLLITLTLTFFTSFNVKPDVSRRLNAAEQLLNGKLREARGVAAMRQSNARLLIHADQAQPELQWHSVTIVVESEPDSNIWEPVGAPEKLPEAIFWVPNDPGADWTGAASFGGQDMRVAIDIGGWQAGALCKAYEFKPTGRISSLRYDCYLSEGFVNIPSEPRLQNPQNLRGLRVNTYGQIAAITTYTLAEK